MFKESAERVAIVVVTNSNRTSLLEHEEINFENFSLRKYKEDQ